ncbi:transporter substrate-binding domain-containing protein [Zooshikella harenae]|uniref:Transporter substrate-binding domain-containing protein n=1 Tax=Zooshikella harenae TaxID=2827238 RepID=A0ABS5ZD15_9GAMM|nr:transporter substrate-binding domain-containing protein [Zooshikella harenae]MBU2711951.1 transporter substrate-binding domain-containing protein [Zooshikella harenae]
MKKWLLMLLGAAPLMAFAAQKPNELVNIVKEQPLRSVSVAAPERDKFSRKDGSGFYWELLKTIYEPLGIELKHLSMPSARALKIADQKYQLLDGLIAQPKLTGYDLLLPKYATHTEKISVVYKKRVIWKWTGKALLKNRIVTWPVGMNFVEKDKRNFRLREFKTNNEAVELVDSGKVHFLIDKSYKIRELFESGVLDKERFEVADFESEQDAFIAFVNRDHSRYLIKIFNTRIEELFKVGKLQALYDKWDIPMPKSLKTQLTVNDT